MPFGYSSTVKTALDQPVFRPIVLVELPGIQRWWSGRGRDLSWNGFTWEGDAPIIGISGGADTASPESHSLQIVFSALDPAIRLLAAADTFLQEVNIYRAFLDDDYEIIPDPILVYSELTDFIALHNGDTPHMTINCENYAILMAQSTPKLRTHQDHLAEYPGDNFYQHVARLVENPLNVLVGYRPPLSL